MPHRRKAAEVGALLTRKKEQERQARQKAEFEREVVLSLAGVLEDGPSSKGWSALPPKLQDLAGQSTSLTQRQALHDRICAYVSTHLRDPSLSVQTVATALNCSKRHLYNAFANESLSISQHIWAERVALFQRELLSPANRHCTLTELALASGFASGAHLSRLFKQHTGKTPAQFRAGMFGSKLLN